MIGKKWFQQIPACTQWLNYGQRIIWQRRSVGVWFSNCQVIVLKVEHSFALWAFIFPLKHECISNWAQIKKKNGVDVSCNPIIRMLQKTQPLSPRQRPILNKRLWVWTNKRLIHFICFVNHFRTSGSSAVSRINPQLGANWWTWFCMNFMITNIFNATTHRK